MSCKLESPKDVLITIDICQCGKISPDMWQMDDKFHNRNIQSFFYTNNKNYKKDDFDIKSPVRETKW